MNNVLILYPKQFNCFSKFSRKIERIFKNIRQFSVTFPDDPNGFIMSYFSESWPEVELIENSNWNIEDVTHGVVYDDGEEFPNEIDILENGNIPLRNIRIDITRVINIRKEPPPSSENSSPEYEYIGRGSYWGNPYSMFEAGEDREEVIRKFRYDFDYDKFPSKEKSQVYKLSGKRLGCFCKPFDCHGDVLAGFLNSWDDGK